MNEKLKKAYLPMSESGFYILLSLSEPRHGYGIILYVKEITGGRISLGAGTIYGTLTKFEKDGIIEAAGEEERRKLYRITEDGKWLLQLEMKRIDEMHANGHKVLGGTDND
ncbi:MAG TPA: PadR family transcriptional regulator [Ruminiclostridium sp.]|nr:PadR family transcriptional regulator [Ruminiclostridium sp.]